MAEQSQFWTTSGTGDGPSGGYTMADWLDIFTKLFVPPGYNTAYNGAVIPGNGSDLFVTGVATPVSVGAGTAMVGGYFYENTTALTLAVTTPTVGTTGGHVILRASTAAQTVRAVAVRNTDGVAAIPALVNTPGTTVEIRLATFTITTGGVIALTDVRAFAFNATKIGPSNLDSAAVTAAALAALAVTTAKIAADAVDDTKIGVRVPGLLRRQGGASATDWSQNGTTNYTLTDVREQVGVTTGVTDDGTWVYRDITFPLAFAQVPHVAVSLADYPTGNWIAVGYALSASQARVGIRYIGGAAPTTVKINWRAVGELTS